MFRRAFDSWRVGTAIGLAARPHILLSPAHVLSRALPVLSLMPVRFASKKTGSSDAKQGRNPRKKSMGLKKSGGQFVKPFEVLMKQRGNKLHAGINVVCGKDYTLHSLCDGHVTFSRNLRPGRLRRRTRTFISVEPLGSNGNEVKRWHLAQTKAYLQVLKRKMQEWKTKKKYERVPERLKKMAKAKLIEDGGDGKLRGDWKAILRTNPRSPAKIAALEAQANILTRPGQQELKLRRTNPKATNA